MNLNDTVEKQQRKKRQEYEYQEEMDSKQKQEKIMSNLLIQTNLLNHIKEIQDCLTEKKYFVKENYQSSMNDLCLKGYYVDSQRFKNDCFIRIMINKDFIKILEEFINLNKIYEMDMFAIDYIIVNQNIFIIIYDQTQLIESVYTKSAIQKILYLIDILIEIKLTTLFLNDVSEKNRIQDFEELQNSQSMKIDKKSSSGLLNQQISQNLQITLTEKEIDLNKVNKIFQIIIYKYYKDKVNYPDYGLKQSLMSLIEKNYETHQLQKMNNMLEYHHQYFGLILQIEHAQELIYYSQKVEKIASKLFLIQNKNHNTDQIYLYYLKLFPEINKYVDYQNQNIYKHLQNIGLLIDNESKNGLNYQLQSLKLLKQTKKGNHIEVAESLNIIGQYYLNIGEKNNAYFHQLESLQMRKQLFSGNHPQIVESLSSISLYHQKENQLKSALEYQVQALEMKKQLYIDPHAEIARSLNLVGVSYEQLGMFQEAIAFQQQSLQMITQLNKNPSPLQADSLSSISSCYMQLGEFQNALKFEIECLQIKEKIYYEIHPQVSNSLNSIGLCYQKLGNPLESLKYHLKSFEMRRQLFKEIHIDIAKSLNNISTCYIDLYQPQKAIEYLLQSLEMTQQIYKGNHSIEIAICLNNVGQCYRDLNQSQLAFKYQFECLEIAESILSYNHPDLAQYNCNLGLCYLDLKHIEEALFYFNNSLKISKINFTGAQFSTANYLYNIAVCKLYLKDFTQALIHAEQSYNIKKEIYDKDHSDIKKSEVLIQVCQKNLNGQNLKVDINDPLLKKQQISKEEEDKQNMIELIVQVFINLNLIFIYRDKQNKEKKINGNRIASILNQHNFINIFIILQDSLQNKFEEINNNVKYMNFERVLLHIQRYQDSQESNKILFDKLNKFFVENDITKKQSQYFHLIIQFIELESTIKKLIEQYLKNQYLFQCKQLYQEQQFKDIIEKQLSFLNLCKKIDQLVSKDNEQFLFQEIEKEYETCFSQAKIEQLEDLLLKFKQLTIIEQEFQKYSQKIVSQMYSQLIYQKSEKSFEITIINTLLQINQLDKSNITPQILKNLRILFSYTEEFQQNKIQFQLMDLMLKIQKQKPDLMESIIQKFKIADNQFFQKVFHQFILDQYNAKCCSLSVLDYVTQNMIITQDEKDLQFKLDELSLQVTNFQRGFDNIIQELKLQNLNQQKLIQSILTKSKQFKFNQSQQTSLQIKWSEGQIKQLIDILIEVSVLWSNQYHHQKKIHVMQICGIMRVLNLDKYNYSQLDNHILNIKPGEGKSLIIGIVSTILALIGFKLDCCQYSQYLSQRDYKDFEQLFNLLQVEKSIDYNTFEKLADKYIQKRFYDQQQNNEFEVNKITDENDRKKIMIIDEVDFFYGDNFMDNSLELDYFFTCKEVVKLIELIWKNRFRNISLKSIKQSQQYRDLIGGHPELLKIQTQVDEEIEKMINDSKQMENHNYLVYKNNVLKIGYKEDSQGISFNSQGYKTVFAYLQEWQNQKIPTHQLHKYLGFNFKLCRLFYLKLLKEYSLIISLTSNKFNNFFFLQNEERTIYQFYTLLNIIFQNQGTLDDQKNEDKEQISKVFNKLKITNMPTIFGKSKIIFNPAQDVYLLFSKETFFNQILKSIRQTAQENRSCIVFFEDFDILLKFKKYSESQGLQNLDILQEIKNDKIQCSTIVVQNRSAILCTKIFGRGTNFEEKYEGEIQKKGIHAIQTFFSDDFYIEKQIQGRVNRLGYSGSYELIINEQDFQLKFNYPFQIINQGNLNLYQTLYKIREDQKRNQNKNKKVQDYQNQHNSQIKKIQLLKQLNGQSLIENKNQIFDFISDCKVNEEKDPHFKKTEIINVQIQEKNDSFNYDKQYSVLIGQFCKLGKNTPKKLSEGIQDLLKNINLKQFKLVEDELTFIEQIIYFDQVWVVSGNYFQNDMDKIEDQFINSILQHLKLRKGLFIFADCDPFVYHANLILKRIPIGYDQQTPLYMKLQGNLIGSYFLNKGDSINKQQFKNHPITLGIEKIYQGSTFCYPKVQNGKIKDEFDDFQDLDIIGTSSDNLPCISVMNATRKRGRIVFDCGFSKLFNENINEGTISYLQNCFQWLSFLDKIHE